MIDEEITYTKLPLLAIAEFPPVVETKDGTKLFRHVVSSKETSKEFFLSLINLIDSGIGFFYKEHQGRYWRSTKLQDMMNTPLIYVYYDKLQENDNAFTETEMKNRNKIRKQSTFKIMAFCSFQYTYLFEDDQDGEKILYLYEIHVSEKVKRNNIGKILLSSFHKVNESLKTTVGTELTVFCQNTVARNWYLNSGYRYSDNNPSDEYYNILFRKTYTDREL